jgi:general secretion pathway protein H
MPTLRMAPGSDARTRAAGLSLVEVLVVLAIVGVMAGATVLGLGSLARGASGEAEALRLAARLRLAADEAMVTSVPLAMTWDAHGYRFLAWDAVGARWRQSGQHDLGARHGLPAALRLEREDAAEGVPIVVTPDVPQAAVLRIAGSGEVWRVAFDGFGTSVATEN